MNGDKFWQYADHKNKQAAILETHQLMAECLKRIAMGKSDDPIKDASRTLRGAGMIAADVMQ